jgi:ketosteroid isomerase-like protein
MDIAVEHVIEHGDELLAVLMVTLKGRGSGVEMESRIAQRWTLREGRLLRMKLQPDADAAVARFEARGTGAH